MQVAKPTGLFTSLYSLSFAFFNSIVETFATNLIGTVNVLEKARQMETVKTINEGRVKELRKDQPNKQLQMDVDVS